MHGSPGVKIRILLVPRYLSEWIRIHHPQPYLFQIEAFCDVTLAVEGSTLKCHKVILAASSLYFQSIFMENTCKHPIVFLKVGREGTYQYQLGR